MAADLGELLVPYMPTIRVPRTGDRVFKSECAFSFDSPVSVPVAPFHTHTHTVRHERLVWGEKVRRRRADSLFCTSSAAHVNLL